jgi:hypothetical protein
MGRFLDFRKKRKILRRTAADSLIMPLPHCLGIAAAHRLGQEQDVLLDIEVRQRRFILGKGALLTRPVARSVARGISFSPVGPTWVTHELWYVTVIPKPGRHPSAAPKLAN